MKFQTNKKQYKNMPYGIDYKQLKKELEFVASLSFVGLAKDG